jgi:hypothetical protein
MMSDDKKSIPNEEQAVHKKAYHSPKLCSFGTVTQLTQAANNMMKADGGPMGMDMIS